MDLKNIADLAKVIDLCRKKGIDSIKITEDTIEFKLAPPPPKATRRKKGDAKESKDSDYVPSDTHYTDEQLLMWSSAGIEN